MQLKVDIDIFPLFVQKTIVFLPVKVFRENTVNFLFKLIMNDRSKNYGLILKAFNKNPGSMDVVIPIVIVIPYYSK